MKRYLLALAWVLWAHEMAMVGDKVVDRGYTAIDSFETRQLCHAAMADYAALRLVRQGAVGAATLVGLDRFQRFLQRLPILLLENRPDVFGHRRLGLIGRRFQ